MSNPLPERELVRLVALGHEDAFRALLDSHLPKLAMLGRRLLGSDAEAEDVSQEAFLRLWRKAGELEIGDAGVGGWLYRVTYNLALDRIRKRRNHSEDGLDQLSVAPRQSVDLEAAEFQSRVTAALDALPERQRLAVQLCHIDGLSMKDAGEILDASEEAIESLLARGRRSLKKELAAEWRSLLPEARD